MVNLSKRGGKDRVFQRLARLLRGISQGRSPREILKSSPASPRKTPSIPTLLLRFTFYFQHGFSKYWRQQENKLFLNAISVHFWWQIANSDITFLLKKFCAEHFCDYLFCCRTPVKSCKKALKDCDKSRSKLWVEDHNFSFGLIFRAI